MALYPFTLNGQTFTLADFVGMNYLTGLPAAIEQLVRQVLNSYGKTLSNTPTFTTGVKNLTGLNGTLFQVGDYVLCYGVGFTAQMSGTVTAFNPVTGTMSVTMDAASGAGTGTTAIVKLGETANVRNLTSALDPALGGTGAGGTFTRTGADNESPFGSSYAGYGASLWDAMAQIYDEGVAPPNSILRTDPLRDNGANCPWYLYNCQSMIGGATNLTEGGVLSTSGVFNVKISDYSLQAANATYGDRGVISCGRGAVRYDVVVRADYLANATYRFGLKCEGSSRILNIFSYGGIGFELQGGNGGFMNFVVGSNGAIYRETIRRIAGGISTTNSVRLSFETDQEGTYVAFSINGAKAAEYNGQLPVAQANYRNLMYPAFEVLSLDGRAVKPLMVDTLNVRKSLSR
jgi:hypothetical protein